MIVFIKPRLMESVVFQATRQDSRSARAYQKEFSLCYDESDPDRRENGFRGVHERWFDKLGFRRRLLDLIDEFEFVRSQVTRFVVSDVLGVRQQGIELFGQPGSYNVVASICPSFLLNEADMSVWARHELQHIDDMLDPDFAFDKSLAPDGPTNAARNLHRDRYALLWAISIDARMEQRGTAPESVKEKRRLEFVRAFGFDDASQADEPFERIWDSMLSERLTHAGLLELARDGLAPAVSQDGTEGRESTPAPGTACPLCSFPTFDWISAAELPEAVVAAVQAENKPWNPADGICGRCAELYRHRATLVSQRPGQSADTRGDHKAPLSGPQESRPSWHLASYLD